MVALEKFVYIPALNSKTSSTISVMNTRKFVKCVEELDFAISAGDKEFSPAVKLILREALELVYNPKNHTAFSYLAATKAIKSTYNALLEIPMKSPIAGQMQQRFKSRYPDSFWDFMYHEDIGKTKRDYGLVVSQGSINKHEYFIAKRLFDFVIAFALLLAMVPLLILVMLCIKFSSPGSIFFIQKRIGSRRIRRAGMTAWEPVQFDFYKFRSMHQDADESMHKEYISKWIEGNLDDQTKESKNFKMTSDPRVTRIGHFIRKTSIDELPQLLNVLKGDMSLVGPRPVPIYEVEAYKKEHYERLATISGITGYWQIHGRGRTTLDQQVQMDVDYIHQQSLIKDLEILLGTPAAVFKGSGAY